MSEMLFRAWYWSGYDMYVWNSFSNLINHGKDVDAVDTAEFLFTQCMCLLISAVLVLIGRAVWRRFTSRKRPA